MVRQNATSTAPPLPASTEELVRGYLTYLHQNGSLPPTPPTPSPSPAVASPMPTPESAPTLTANGRSFSRPGRGTGGALKAKQLASKQVTTPAVKRKAFVDPEAETLPPTPESTENANPKPAKRPKTTKVPRTWKVPQRVASPTPTPDDEPIESPISTSTPPTPLRPPPRPAKQSVKTEKPQNVAPSGPLILDDNPFVGAQENEGNDGGDASESEVEILDRQTPAPILSQNSMFAGFPMNLQMLHAYMAQMGGGAGLPFHAPPTTTMQPQLKQTKSSKGIKAYPDGWQQVLNSAKDIVRSSILLKVPFPGPNQARVAVNEAFHEALAIECNNGLVLEPGFSWCDSMMMILLTEISTCRSELKKLAKILVTADSQLFPSSENLDQPLLNQPPSEIRMIAAKSEKRGKRRPQPHPLYDPDLVRASITSRLTDFGFLNDPPTDSGEFLASPILEKLCQSFYEEEKWQRSLALHAEVENEWMFSVPLMMVALAATAYRNALEEWRTGHWIPRQFEADKFSEVYNKIYDAISDRLDDDPWADAAAERLRSWAEDSIFVQDMLGETGSRDD